MIDLHTHILPGMDDGAKTAEDSLAMLRQQQEQGVTAVALTPHFYRDRERPESFLRRRREAFLRLQEALPTNETMPRLLLGAEVTWMPNLCHWEGLSDFCLEGTKQLLLELPFTPWTDSMVNQIYDLMNGTGITPILAHLERYLKGQRREMVEAVLSLELPVQLSSGVLLSPLTRGRALKLLKNGTAHFLASDCHGPERRRPSLGPAMEVVRKKLGTGSAEAFARAAWDLLKE